MPKYVRTLSFYAMTGKFKPPKDDPQINSTLDQLRAAGATIDEIRSLLSASFGMVHMEHAIVYEAPSEIRQ